MRKSITRRSVSDHFLYRLSCLAVEEKHVDEVSMEPLRRDEFVASYRRKIKEDRLSYEIKVSSVVSRVNIIIVVLFGISFLVSKQLINCNSKLFHFGILLFQFYLHC